MSSIRNNKTIIIHYPYGPPRIKTIYRQLNSYILRPYNSKVKKSLCRQKEYVANSNRFSKDKMQITCKDCLYFLSILPEFEKLKKQFKNIHLNILKKQKTFSLKPHLQFKDFNNLKAFFFDIMSDFGLLKEREK